MNLTADTQCSEDGGRVGHAAVEAGERVDAGQRVPEPFGAEPRSELGCAALCTHFRRDRGVRRPASAHREGHAERSGHPSTARQRQEAGLLLQQAAAGALCGRGSTGNPSLTPLILLLLRTPGCSPAPHADCLLTALSSLTTASLISHS